LENLGFGGILASTLENFASRGISTLVSEKPYPLGLGGILVFSLKKLGPLGLEESLTSA